MTNTGFCTIFQRKENSEDIAITTFPVEKGYTEKEAKDYFVMDSGLVIIGKEEDFDKNYRILIG